MGKFGTGTSGSIRRQPPVVHFVKDCDATDYYIEHRCDVDAFEFENIGMI